VSAAFAASDIVSAKLSEVGQDTFIADQ
jgi:hypothetical protein